jgi:GcrA cell cycle regulator
VKPGEEKEAPKRAAKPAAAKPARASKPEAPAAAANAADVAPGDAPSGPGPDLPPEPQQRPKAPSAPDSTLQYRSVGPGGFIRQGPGDTQAPIPPAPPRRLVPAKPSAEVADKTSLLDLNDRICRWPIGHPGEPDFHFCGQQANPGFPYCVQHCGVAYQAQLPRRDRRPPPPLPFGGPRVR